MNRLVAPIRGSHESQAILIIVVLGHVYFFLMHTHALLPSRSLCASCTHLQPLGPGRCRPLGIALLPLASEALTPELTPRLWSDSCSHGGRWEPLRHREAFPSGGPMSLGGMTLLSSLREAWQACPPCLHRHRAQPHTPTSVWAGVSPVFV